MQRECVRMARLPVVLGVLAAVMVLAGSALGDPGAEKAGVDARLGEAREKAEQAARTAGVLTTEVRRLGQAARSAEAALATEQARLTALEASLAAEQDRLADMGREVDAQNERLAVLQQQYRAALRVLEQHVRAIYLSDSPDLISFAVGATSFGELINNLDLLDRIGQQDQRIAGSFDTARIELARARVATVRTRQAVSRAVATIAARTAAQRAARDGVASRRDVLAAAEAEKAQALAGVREDRATFVAEADALAAESAALAARIQAAQSATATPSPARSGAPATPPTSTGARLSWPVSGPITSGFGPRWGRMHEGIDISVGTGTPVRAASGGTVIYAGWLGGYGNLVVVDHGGGLSTAYAHNSSLSVGQGASVGAGTVIALSGNTGASSGPHVHFEVRVNGSAVDPLRYL